jgi:hypothetical protein
MGVRASNHLPINHFRKVHIIDIGAFSLDEALVLFPFNRVAHAANFSRSLLQHLFLQLRHFTGRVLDRFDNILISGTAAEITGNPPPNFLFCGMRIPFEKSLSGQDHSGGTKSALKPMFLLKAFLQRVKLSVISHPFDRANFLFVRLSRKNGA